MNPADYDIKPVHKHPASMEERIEATRQVEAMSFSEYEAEREAMVGVSPVVQAVRDMERDAEELSEGALKIAKFVRGTATCFKPGRARPRGTIEQEGEK